MPRGDRTGPLGMGERTGRTAGFCAGFGVPGYANQIPGRGFGLGFGRGRGGGGRGHRNMFHATGLPGWARFGGYDAPYAPPAAYQNPDPELTRQLLKRQAEDLQSELEMVKKRLAEVEGKTAAEYWLYGKQPANAAPAENRRDRAKRGFHNGTILDHKFTYLVMHLAPGYL